MVLSNQNLANGDANLLFLCYNDSMKNITLSIMLAVLLLSLTIRPMNANAGAEGDYKVVADSLQVREEGSQSAKVIGSLKYGTIVSVSQEKYGWMQMKSSKVSGWVAGHYLKKIEGSAASSSSGAAETASSPAKPSIGIVTGDSVRLREGPGTSYAVLGSVNKGDKLTIQESKTGWYHAKTAQGVLGWISSQFVSVSGIELASGPTASGGGLKGKVIVVDPGHGGSDPGMVGTTQHTEEKNLTLSTSILLADQLQRLGAKVILTRTKDSEKPSLADRVKISESAGADAFVSIHYNSSTKNNSGTLTFYYSEQKDRPLARSIEAKLSSGIGLKSNGISYGDYHVLRENDVPSALLELGFLTNESDEELVKTSGYQRKAAAAIASGLEAYFK
ncbi:N-acetylmuramoyl-L-alanine amidase [Paenibacillus sp. GCM10023252]|uniref:N-acetylmuramoyl-L-alanine amidase n=1 Tax=Paenibacillus sp. GCM10023252 TaxID=3252649 RepID=UPI0036102C4B